MNIDNKIIITPHSLSSLLLEQRRVNPYLNFSILSLEDIQKELYPQIKEGSLHFLLKETDYPIKYIEEITSLINKGINPSASNDVKKIYDLLNSNNFLESNNLIKQKFKNKNVLVIGYDSSNKELDKVLSLLDKSNVEYLPLKELVPHNKEQVIFRFKNSDEEVRYVFNLILSSNNQSIKKCIVADSCYESLLNIYAYQYGVKLNFKTKESALYTSLGKELLGEIKKGVNPLTYITSKKEGLDKEDITYKLLDSIELVIRSNLYDILDKNTFENVSYLLDKIKLEKIHYSNEIDVTSSLEFNPNVEYYVLGAVDTFLPSLKKNNRFLDDSILEKNFINSSEIENKEIETLSEVFATSSFIEHISYPLINGKENNYKTLFIQDEKDPEPLKFDYSKEIAASYYSKAIDIQKKYNQNVFDLNYKDELDKKHVDLDSYDSSFSGITQNDSSRDLCFSYSSLNTLYSCPFKYYVEQILHITDYESSFPSKLGSFIHKIFENVRTSSFEEALHLAKSSLDYDSLFSKKEQMFFEADQDIIKYAYENIKNNIFNKLSIKESKHEYKRTLNVREKDKSLSLTGSIDCFFKKDDGSIIILDFKSGSFEVGNTEKYKAGLALQLLIYSYMLSKDPIYKDSLDVHGIYYAPVISKEINFNSEKFKKSFQLKGLTFKPDIGFEDLISNKGKLDDGLLSDYLKTVEDRLTTAENKVRDSKFNITPTSLEEPCKYCSYKNICYVRKAKENLNQVEESEVEDNE